MQNWAKRGLQTALVTGGMLMLGTGIASAQENVDPDRPASPLDGSVTIPVDVGNNAVGTPFGQYDGPEHQGEYSTKQVTEPIKEAIAGSGGAPSAAKVTEAAAPVTEATESASAQLRETGAPVTQRADVRQEAEEDPFRGNRASADLVVPIQIANNALALFGPAEVSGGDHQQSYDGSSDVETDGNGESLAGNVVDIDWAVPVQIANNAGGWGAAASSTGNNASQDTTTGGDVTTDGSGGVLSGNVLAPQGATPLTFNNNAVAWGGTADSSGNTSSSDASSGGALETDGSDGVLSGNIGGGPLAAPLGLNNNAASWGGVADSSDNGNTTTATAGGTKTGMNDIPAYAQTDGDDSVLSGNIVQPQGAGNGTGHGIAGTWGGISTTDGNSNETSTKAGGFSSTSGVGSVGGGNLADAPVALPVEGFCSAGSWIGIASSTNCENTTEADAGGGTFTDGEGSTGGGNGVHTPLASTVEAFGIGGTWIGKADAEATEDKTVDAGGYNGSRGDDSTVGGNIVQTPVATPVEMFGVGGAWIGDGSGTASETKDVNSGGDGNTSDDNGTGSSNVVATPIAQPVQAFGIGGAWGGSGHGAATAETNTEAGGDYTGSGKGGALSGNIVQAASSAPAQAFGLGAVWGGDASGTGDNTSSSTAGGTSTTDGSQGEGSGNIATAANSLPLQAHGMGASWIGEGNGTGWNVTDSTAGGDSSTDGTGSSTGGNVISAPIAGAGTAFGNAGTFIGHASGEGSNDIVSTGGGSTETAGDEGSLAGNVVSAQALPVAQVFGNAASVAGIADAVGTNTTDVMSGGDVTTSGVNGSMSGNIFDLPAAAVAQIFGNAGTLGGQSTGIGDNTTTGVVGGATQTAGENSSLSGFNDQVPLGALLQIFSFSLPLGGEALGLGTNVTDVNIAGELPQIFQVFNGSEMAIDGLPSLDALPAASMQRDARSDVHSTVTPAMMPKPISAPADPAAALPVPAPGVPAPGVPAPGELGSDVPVPAPGELGTDLPVPAPAPEVPALDGLPALPEDLDQLPALPAEPGVAMPMPAPAVPEVNQTLPAPGAPEAAMPLPAPAAPEVAPALPALPAEVAPKTAHTMPAPAVPAPAVQQAGFKGMWAKFVGMLTNKPMHIES